MGDVFPAAASGACSVAAGAGEEGLGGGSVVVNAGAHASAGRPPPSRERKTPGSRASGAGDGRSDAGRHQVQPRGRCARPEAPRAQRRGVQARGVLRGEGKRRLQQIAGLLEAEWSEGQRNRGWRCVVLTLSCEKKRVPALLAEI